MPSELDSSRETYEAAHALHELGYHLVPCQYGGKRPLIRWKDAGCSHRLIDAWFDRFGPGINIAIHAGKSGIVGLDADTGEAAAWIAKHCPPTPMRATTPRGGRHAYFRAPGDVPSPTQGLFGIGLDVRSRTSLLLASPSWSRDHRRRWTWTGPVLPPSELPVIDPDLIRTRPIPKRNPGGGRCSRPPPGADTLARIAWAEERLSSLYSIEHEGGDHTLFLAACILIQRARLDYGTARHLLMRWNEDGHAQPPWGEDRIAYKLGEAIRLAPLYP